MLSVLLPALEARGERPTVLIGTSVGAINAAFIGANAHLPAEELVAKGRERWLAVRWRDILKPILAPGTALTGVRYAGAVAGLPGVDLSAFLDPSPLAGTLEDWIDWDSLHANVRDGALDSVSVVATAARTARSAVFLESAEPPSAQSTKEIDYVATKLDTSLVRASAAIPVAFPAIWVDHPADDVEGWYFDGGSRLNTPLKPALDLDVDRVIVIASHSVDPRNDGNWHRDGMAPDFGDAAVQLLFAALVDSLIADVKMLGKINLMAEEAAAQANAYRRERGRPEYRRIPYMFISPPSRDCIGDIAHEAFERHYDGISGLLHSTNIGILARLLGGITEPHGELLSYLMFAEEFTAAAIEQGEVDARRWLDRDWGEAGPWLTAPIDTLDDPD